MHTEYHDTPDAEVRYRMNLPATREVTFDMRSADVWSLFDKDGNIGAAPFKTAGKELPIAQAILQQSVVAQLGCRLIWDTPQFPNPTGQGIPIMSVHPASFGVIRPLPLVDIANGSDVPVTPFNIPRETIHRDETDVVAYATMIPRRHSVVPGQTPLLDEIMRGLILGIAQVVDRKVLERISAATLDTFSIPKAIAQGLLFESLAAISGPATTGIHVDVEGNR